MAHTRTKSRKPGVKPESTELTNGSVAPSTEVFNLADAAAYLRVTESQVLQLVHDQALPCRRFGTEWRFLKAAIQDWLRTPPKPGTREAILSVAGAWKDDPYLEEELKEIYRKRGRPMTEEG